MITLVIWTKMYVMKNAGTVATLYRSMPRILRRALRLQIKSRPARNVLSLSVLYTMDHPNSVPFALIVKGWVLQQLSGTRPPSPMPS